MPQQTFIICVTLWTLVEATGVMAAVRWRQTPWISFPLFFRLPWAVFTLFAAWFCITTGDYDVMVKGFPLPVWTFGVVLELAYLPAFFAAYAVTLLVHRHRQGPPSLPWNRMSLSPKAVWVLWGFYAVAAFAALTAPEASYARLTTMNIRESGAMTTRLASFRTFFITFYWPAYAALVAGFLSRRETRGPLPGRHAMPVIAATGVSLVLLARLVAVGQRSMMFEPLVLLGMVLLWKRRYRLAAVLACGLTVVVVLTAGLFERFRTQTMTMEGGLSARFSTLAETDQFLSPGERVTEAVRALARRGDLQFNGGLLADYAHIHGFSRWAPYKGILFFAVPKILMPNKPVPRSEDGTYSGLAVHIASRMRTHGMGPDYGTATVSDASEAYWQFGFAGVILTGLISGFWTAACSVMFLRRGHPLGLFLFLTIRPGGALTTILFHQVLRKFVPYLILCAIVARIRPWAYQRMPSNCDAAAPQPASMKDPATA